jgi:GT2 family glycosyltransferase
MSRTPVSVAILAWNSWETTKACLDSLRPTLGVRDQVVVVNNGSTDGTASGLGAYPWVDVVTNAANRGFAGGCNDAARPARHDLIIFLNNDTLLAPRWIEPLVAAFEDPAVGAVGPRSNFVSGPQIVPEAVYGSPADMRRFARSWSAAHRAMTSSADRLVGFAIAVRRSVFEALGGFDERYGIGGFEDDDLCRRIIARGYKLLISHESFVHHDGHKTFDANGLDWYAEQESNRARFVATHGQGADSGRPVMISACLITKDEEERIGDCLASLDGFADEVIVYDTGSTDATVELARAAGATVIEGYWDDDFSRARNDALAYCKGDWIAWLDADETLQVDEPARLRSLLAATRSDIDAWSVKIDNLTGAGVGSSFSHHAARLFRRARCEWTGRLHEQVALRAGHAAIVQAELSEGAWIRHTGYLDASLQARNKADRNIRLAQAEVVDADGWDRGYSLTSLGRSLILAGRTEEGLARLIEALEVTDNQITRRLALPSAISAAAAIGRVEDALDLCARFRSEGGDSNTSAALEAPLRLASGDAAGALRLLDGVVTGVSNRDGFSQSSGAIAVFRAQALTALGRPGEAADALLGVLGEDGVLDTHLGRVVELLESSGRDLGDLAAALPVGKLKLFMAQLLQLSSEAADRTLEACYAGPLDRTIVLAAASKLAQRLETQRSIVWSARLRQAGFAASCPLIARATSNAPVVLRALSAAVACTAFNDQIARRAFEKSWEEASLAERSRIVSDCAVIAPGLLSSLSSPESSTAASPQSGSSQVTSAGSRAPVGSTPLASIVIPCFNKAELTAECLKSVYATADPSTYEMIIIDNGSSDATRLISGESDWFHVIRNDTTVGSAKARNQGIQAARSDLIVFLNNDIVAVEGWLESILSILDHEPGVGAVGARLLQPNGTIQHAGIDVIVDDTIRCHGRYLGMPANHPEASVLASVQAVTGAAIAVRRAALDQVGGFWEEYWNGHEDVDLCLGFRDAGWDIVYEPACTLIQSESQSGPERYSRYQHNVDTLNARWLTRLASSGFQRSNLLVGI